MSVLSTSGKTSSKAAKGVEQTSQRVGRPTAIPRIFATQLEAGNAAFLTGFKDLARALAEILLAISDADMRI
ncbi:MAG: hypothetical protein P8R45_06295, partial [Candidatus Binatia bacterium]|nr:hypothetical protein [Candidatus Binatia bacterium]